VDPEKEKSHFHQSWALKQTLCVSVVKLYSFCLSIAYITHLYVGVSDHPNIPNMQKPAE